MIHAYDESYLSKTRRAMGDMLHFAVYDLKWDISKFYKAFISTGLAHSVEIGTPTYTVGKSGYELAFEVYYRLTGAECEVSPVYVFGKTPEYFAGWAVAYYSWYKNMPFEMVDRFAPIASIVNMYNPFHEMDIMHFVEALDSKMSAYSGDVQLKRLRKYADLTQKMLATRSGVSQRMIEQYEQGRKDLKHASAETVIHLARALNCSVEELIG